MTNSKKNVGLESIRGGAALMVMFGHFFHYLNNLRAYADNHIVALFFNWGRECVLLFFILSGIVVHYAFDKRHRNKLTFVKERIIRLHPTLIISLVLCLTIEYYYFNGIPPINTIFGNLVPYSTMSGYLAPLLWNTNAAIWSLTFEMFFYLIFGFFIIKKATIKINRVHLWFILSILSIYFYHHPTKNALIDHFIMMLSFSGIWLIGFYIYKWKNIIYTDSKIALTCTCILPLVSRLHLSNTYYDPVMFNIFGLTAVPLFAFLLQPRIQTTKYKKETYLIILAIYIIASIILSLDSSYTPLSKILYITLPILAFIITYFKIIFSKVKYIANQYIIKPISFFGKYSYSIYLIHTPIIILANQFSSIGLFIKLPMIVLITFSISYLIENIVQPNINKKLL